MLHSPSRCDRAGRLLLFSRLVFSITFAALCCSAQAQSMPPPASSASSADISPSERAKRDAEKVFQWIRIHSDKPRKAATAAPAERPTPVAAKAVKPARVPDSGITEAVQALPAARTPARTEAAARPAEPAAVPASQPREEPASPAVVARTGSGTPSAASPVVEEDVRLTPIYKTEPDFSGSLMRTLRKGMVQVSFTVQPDGSVAQAQVVSTTHPRLAQTAIATVSQWRFQPLRHPQQAVVDLGFNLD